MGGLLDGEYEFVQKLPNLKGELGDAASFEGNVKDVPLVDVMRHCEDNALSCIVQVTKGEDVSELHYRTGELDRIFFNGERDEDRIMDILGYEEAGFRVSAPPLDLDIAGWPSIREPTAPFRIVGDRLERIAPGEKIHKPQASEPDEEAAPPAKSREAKKSKDSRKSKKSKKSKQSKQGKQSRIEKGVERAEESRSSSPKERGKVADRLIQPGAGRRDVPEEDAPRSSFSAMAVVATLAVFAALWGYVLFRALAE